MTRTPNLSLLSPISPAFVDPATSEKIWMIEIKKSRSWKVIWYVDQIKHKQWTLGNLKVNVNIIVVDFLDRCLWADRCWQVIITIDHLPNSWTWWKDIYRWPRYRETWIEWFEKEIIHHTSGNLCIILTTFS